MVLFIKVVVRRTGSYSCYYFFWYCPSTLCSFFRATVIVTIVADYYPHCYLYLSRRRVLRLCSGHLVCLRFVTCCMTHELPRYCTRQLCSRMYSFTIQELNVSCLGFRYDFLPKEKLVRAVIGHYLPATSVIAY